MTPGPLHPPNPIFPRALRAQRRATRERATRGGDTLCELFDNHSGSAFAVDNNNNNNLCGVPRLPPGYIPGAMASSRPDLRSKLTAQLAGRGPPLEGALDLRSKLTAHSSGAKRDPSPRRQEGPRCSLDLRSKLTAQSSGAKRDPSPRRHEEPSRRRRSDDPSHKGGGTEANSEQQHVHEHDA